MSAGAAPQRQITVPDGVIIRWAALDDPALARSDLLGAREVARAARYRFALHRERYVRACVALRLLLGELTGADPAGVRLDVDSAGAPLAVGNLRYSVSHTGDLAAFAVTEDRRIGVDVELLDAGDPVIAASFHSSEQAWLARASSSTRAHEVVRLWTAKEAYLKALGLGLLRPLDSFEILAGEHGALRLSDPGDVGAARRWTLTELSAPRGAVATLAVERRGLDAPLGAPTRGRPTTR